MNFFTGVNFFKELKTAKKRGFKLLEKLREIGKKRAKFQSKALYK